MVSHFFFGKNQCLLLGLLQTYLLKIVPKVLSKLRFIYIFFQQTFDLSRQVMLGKTNYKSTKKMFYALFFRVTSSGSE